MDPVISLTAMLLLSFVFVIAGLHKREDRVFFEATLSGYELVPPGLTAPLSRIIPWLEIGGGIALLVPPLRTAALVIVGGLLVVYTSAIAFNLLRGRRDIDCGCAGPGMRQNLSGFLLVRNGLLAVAWLAAVSSAARPLVWLDWLVIVAATALACAAWTTFNLLLANRDKLMELNGHG
ncbi:MAG: methylamine utilization protein MauE [Gammaproteobacteria bacterium]|nr:methylamine utilization protein MauE [Gammaproteobacteria bacterium]